MKFHVITVYITHDVMTRGIRALVSTSVCAKSSTIKDWDCFAWCGMGASAINQSSFLLIRRIQEQIREPTRLNISIGKNKFSLRDNFRPYSSLTLTISPLHVLTMINPLSRNNLPPFFLPKDINNLRYTSTIRPYISPRSSLPTSRPHDWLAR